MDFNGKIVIVTGAAQGMGASHAKAFIDQGATVVLTDVNATEGQATADQLGDHAHFMSQDVTSEADWQRVVEDTTHKFGHLDVLVNNAGITYSKSLFDVSTADYLKIFKINQLSVFLGTKYAAAALELAHDGIRVNSVHPGVIDTPMIHQGDTDEAVKQFAKMIPLQRVAQPEEISKAVLFLASDDSSYATGAEFVFDGGLTAQ